MEAGWLDPDDGLESAIAGVILRHPGAAVGIDSPRVPLPAPRRWYWTRDRWRLRRPTEQGFGRHCEVAVKAHGIANPQWTPLAESVPAWMQIGFRVFESVASRAAAFEVFPTASYRLLASEPDVRVRISFQAFEPGPKDVLDAVIAAATVREFSAGRGTAVGGGDGLGEIVLPRPLPNPIPAVLTWPPSSAG